MLHHCCVLPKQMTSTAKTFNSWIQCSIDVNESDSCSARRKCYAKSSAFKKSVCVLEWREDRLVKRSCLSGAFETEHGIQDHSCDVDWQGIPVCDGDGISDGVITAHTDPWRVCQLLHQPVIASCFTRAHRPNTGPCIYTETEINQGSGQKYHWKWQKKNLFSNDLLSVIF